MSVVEKTLFGDVGGASIDESGRYRYHLWRHFLPGERTILYVMLNPSTADARLDDQTIRRCRSFAVREEFERLEVVNLFAWRATKPRELLDAADPVGPLNDATIAGAAARAHMIVLAYGSLRRRWWDRADEVLDLLSPAGTRRPLWTLGSTQDGFPRHPSRLPNDATLELF